VEAALKKAEWIAAKNPWVAESLGELRAIAAQKDEELFSKEAAFSAFAANTAWRQHRAVAGTTLDTCRRFKPLKCGAD
jgi:hypothetical protein